MTSWTTYSQLFPSKWPFHSVLKNTEDDRFLSGKNQKAAQIACRGGVGGYFWQCPKGMVFFPWHFPTNTKYINCYMLNVFPSNLNCFMQIQMSISVEKVVERKTIGCPTNSITSANENCWKLTNLPSVLPFSLLLKLDIIKHANANGLSAIPKTSQIPMVIPDICNFFTLTHFQAWKFYTQKCLNLRQKLLRDKTA